jgi:hypothetical protein
MKRSIVPAMLLLSVVSCGDPPPPKVPVPKASPVHPQKPVGEPIAPTAYTHGGPSYEEALAVPEDLNATKDAPELTDAQLSAPMANGEMISECGAPETMKVVVKVAVRDGRAMGATVATSPESVDVATCVDKAVRAMSWPVSAKRFTFTTAY